MILDNWDHAFTIMIQGGIVLNQQSFVNQDSSPNQILEQRTYVRESESVRSVTSVSSDYVNMLMFYTG